MNTYLKLKQILSGSARSCAYPLEEHPDRAETPEYLETSRRSIAEMDTQGYERYAAKYGHHFTPDLAAYAAGQMINSDRSKHLWTCEEIRGAFDRYGYKLPENATIGDACYLANMAYADLYPQLLTEAQCVKYAYVVLQDPDGYEGMTFLRYISDNIGRGTEIEWERYIG